MAQCDPLALPHGNTRAVSVLERSVRYHITTVYRIGASDDAICHGRGRLPRGGAAVHMHCHRISYLSI